MKTRCLILLMALGAFILAPQPAIADDLADLKAADGKLFNAWNTSDVEGIFDAWSDTGIWLSDSRAFPLTHRNLPERKAYWAKWFETHSVRMMWYNPQYLVIGNTGLVWGHVTQTAMNKVKGIGKEIYLKMSITYVKSEGKWKVVLCHSSPMPSERELF